MLVSGYPVRWCAGDGRVAWTWPPKIGPRHGEAEAKLGLGLIFMGYKVGPR